MIIEEQAPKLKILFVVHRYAPFPGGSEQYVQWMAEETQKRGYDVTVLSHIHHPSVFPEPSVLNGVRLSVDYQILVDEKWNLIVVHGGDCVSQNVVHQYASQMPSPVLYLIIKPSISPLCVHGVQQHPFLGYSTAEDYEHIVRFDMKYKARRVRHGINKEESLATTEIVGDFFHFDRKEDAKIFVSAGGFWPHKGFDELAEVFNRVFENTDNELWLFGYDESVGKAPPNTKNVISFLGMKRETVLQAIKRADAYIMNSTEEGFGLVLLESLLNNTPWMAREIAGAIVLKNFGTTYKTKEELEKILIAWRDSTIDKKEIVKETAIGKNYVEKNCLIQNTVDDIIDVLEEAERISNR